MSENRVTEVVAGILRDAHGRILVSRRQPGSHLAGTWEFPGGKLDPGETPASALGRELAEELGVRVTESTPLLTLTHRYPDKSVRLHIREVKAWTGHIRGRESQPVRWADPTALSCLEMPAADHPVIRALDLCPRYAISPDPSGFPERAAFLRYWAGLLDQGAWLVQLRAHGLDAGALAGLARECGDLARAAGACWLLNADPDTARSLGADGVHLTAARLRALKARPHPGDWLVAASCHDQAELEQAGRIGADFCTLSPVRATPGHALSAPLGWEAFAMVCRSSPVPVYALGGVEPGDLDTARAYGAFGVAGIRAFGPGR